MTYVVTLEGFTPGVRYDALPWTGARVEESSDPGGPWTSIQTFVLTPVDTNPAAPIARNFTTALATSATDWFRVVFTDAGGHEQATVGVYVSPQSFQTVATRVDVIVAQVKTEYTFDASNEQILRWLNVKHKLAVARTEILRARMVIGEGVEGQQTYALPGEVISVKELVVAGTPFTRAAHRDLSLVAGGWESIVGVGGIYTPDRNAGADRQVTLSPAPAAGASIEVYASIRANDLGMSDYLATPPEFDEAIADGTASTGYKREPEQLGVAQTMAQEFDAKVEELRRQVRREARGGPARIRIEGFATGYMR